MRAPFAKLTYSSPHLLPSKSVLAVAKGVTALWRRAPSSGLSSAVQGGGGGGGGGWLSNCGPSGSSDLRSIAAGASRTNIGVAPDRQDSRLPSEIFASAPLLGWSRTAEPSARRQTKSARRVNPGSFDAFGSLSGKTSHRKPMTSERNISRALECMAK